MSELDTQILEKLGSLTAQIRSDVSKKIKTGINISEIINFIETEIFKNNYLPAFPATVSVNEVAAHYTVFNEDYKLQKGDVIKIDFGISESGFITDNAFTIEVDDNKYEKLLIANKKGLDKALEMAEIGVSMSEIGTAVNEIATENGFNTIHNLSGHEIGKNDLHCGLSVPNYKNGDSSKIISGMELAIEPFFTIGNPKVKNGGNSNILHLIANKPLRDPIAKKVLEHIKKNYPSLPFSKRWLIKDIITKLNPNQKDGFDSNRVSYALSLLKRDGIIHEYEKLVTVDSAIVSQFEDTILFVGNQKKIITRI